jgi:hypothetical protein
MVLPAEVAAGPASPATTSCHDRCAEWAKKRAGKLLTCPLSGEEAVIARRGELPGPMAADG